MMKNYKQSILFCLFAFLTATTFATNYYVSSSSGNDSYSAAEAQNPSTPWQSLPKVNSFASNLKPGDFVLFKRGDVFYGSLIISASGNSSAKITIGAYGSGAKPLFSGFAGLGSWINNGGGIWQCTVPTSSTALKLVTINGTPQAVGRFPNADASNGGYLTYEAWGNGYIADYQLSGSPNWTGADLVVRKNHFIIDVCKINNHSGNAINYTFPGGGATNYPAMNNFGYFIQNDPRTLDKFGEWYFNAQTKVLQMYFGGDSPSNYSILAAAVDNVLNLDASQNGYITLDNLAIEGANQNGVYELDGNSLTVQNCDINNIGSAAILVKNIPNTNLQNNQISNALNYGIDINNSVVSPSTVRYNNIRNIGLYAGNGQTADGGYTGISIFGDNLLVEYNTLDAIGFDGITFQGNNVNIKNNFVNNFCSVKDDGGGVYTWDGTGETVYYNRVINGNIITNAIGAKFGCENYLSIPYEDARGIYLDGASMNVNVTNNSVANCVGSGFYYNNVTNVNTSGNTIFNAFKAIYFARFPNGPLLRNNATNNNILFPLQSNQGSIFYWNGDLNTPTTTDIQSDLRAIGSFDNNYYRNDVPYPFDYYYHITNGGTFIDPPPLVFNQWTSFMNMDYNSKTTLVIPAYTINGYNTGNTVQNPQFTSGISGINFWSPNGNYTASWDNSGKISGGSIKIAPSSSVLEFTTIFAPLGSVTAGKSYIFRFTTLGSNPYGYIKASLRQSNSPFATFTDVQSRSFGSSQQTHEILISPSVSEANASYQLELLQSSGTVYIDNMEFYEVNASKIDVTTQVRFEYNPSQSDKNITLDANYLGVDNTKYSGTVTLAPFTSKIFIRDNSVSQPVVTAPSTSTLSASSSAASIACFGGSTNVTVSGSGGSAPYTGTGSFSATAGTGSLKLSSSSLTSGNNTMMYYPIGAVSSSKSYVLRFTTLGTTNNGSIRGSLRMSTSPYTVISTSQTKTFGTTRVDHQIIMNNPTSAADASFLLELDQSSGTTYIDNIAVFEALSNGTLTSKNLYAAGNFENGISQIYTWSSNGAGIAELDNNSMVNNTNYYSITDATGAVRTTGVVIGQPATPLKASVSYPPITTLGGSTTVTLTATGGTPPYIGPGTSNVGSGSYSYDVTDANGCKTSVAFVIEPGVGSVVTSPIQPSTGTTDAVTTGGGFAASSTASAISCFGGSTVATVNGAGGTAPYVGTGSFDATSGTNSLKISSSSSSASTRKFTLIYYPIGAVSSSKNYILKFSTLGTTDQGMIRGSMRMSGSPYTVISNVAIRSYGTNRIDHQIVINNPATTNDASFLLELDQNSGTTYIDDIQVFELASDGSTIGSNLYAPGNFESGVSQVYTWSLKGANVTQWENSSILSGSGALKLSTKTSINNQYTLIYYPIGPVSSSTNYALTFTTRGTTDFGVIKGSLRMSGSPYTVISSTETKTFGTSRVDHKIIFNNPNSADDASFLLELDQSSGTTYIDNIAVFEAGTDGTLTGPNLYTAGNFENGISQIYTWALNGANIAELDNNSMINNINYYSISDATGAVRTTGVIISQPDAPLAASVSYAPITTSGGMTTVMLTATGGTAPYVGPGPSSAGAGSYSYEVTDARGCKASIAFVVAPASAARIATATTSTSNLSMGASMLSSSELSVITYPNPSSNVFNVKVSGGTAEKVSIRVMGYDGKQLYQTVGLSNQTYTFGSNFIAGMYIVEVKQGTNVKMFKMIKGKL
jgi:hypothetical protein